VELRKDFCPSLVYQILPKNWASWPLQRRRQSQRSPSSCLNQLHTTTPKGFRKFTRVSAQKHSLRMRAERHAFAYLQSASAAPTLLAGRICRDRSNIFNSADLQTRPCKGSHGRLRPWPRCLSRVAARRAQLDVNGSDAQLLQAFRYFLCSSHGSIRGGFVAVCLDFHAASSTNKGFTPRQIRYVDKRVIEGREEVTHTEEILILPQCRSKLLRFRRHSARAVKAKPWSYQQAITESGRRNGCELVTLHVGAHRRR
jgi:hypothetical protein